jgi:sugar fermentation stimulation protein A
VYFQLWVVALMDFDPALQVGTLIRRYKRFLADIVDAEGRAFTIHCPNPGAMSGCAEPGSRVWYSQSTSASRKYACTLEIIETSRGELVGVNPSRANAIVAEALAAGRIGTFDGLHVSREVAIPGNGGRFDFRLDRGEVRCYIEVKSVTLSFGDGLGAFPDAKSDRARRHVMLLQQMRDDGHRAVLLFCVQHSGVERVTTADEIDPAYGIAVRTAQRAGVEVMAFRTRVSVEGLTLADELPVCL